MPRLSGLPVLLLLSLCAPASAAVLDVFADGSGPYADLSQALDAAQPGDTLRLGDGLFTGAGNRNLILWGPRLTILSASGEPADCVLDLAGEGRAFLIYSAPTTSVHIAGITFRGGDPRQLPEEELRAYGGALAVDGLTAGGMLLVERCVFEDQVADAGGGAFLYEAEALWRDCVFRRNSATDGAGVYCGQCGAGAGVRFEGCLFQENGYPYPGVGGYGAGVYFSHSAGSVAGCTLAHNRAWLGGGLLVSTASGVTVDSTLIAFSTEGEGLAVYAGAVVIERCDLFGNEGGDWVGAIAGRLGLDGNVSADPLFCDAAAGDYTLRDDSPCLPENNGCCLIGAFGEGCSGSSTVIEGPTLFDDAHASHGSRAGAAERGRVAALSAGGGAIEITLRLESSGPVRLQLFDALGRRCATLFEGPLAAGVHRLAPPVPAGARGAPLPSGLYWLRLESAGGRVSRALFVLH